MAIPIFSQEISTDWNLLSFPIHPRDPAVETVLSSLAGNHGLVYAYDGCNSVDPWKSFDPGAPSYANDLHELENFQGFWVQMSAPGSLELSGSAPGFGSISLCAGWNLIGFPALEAQPLADALSSIDGCYNLVYTYEAADVDDPWKKFDVSAPAFANDLREMKPGYGYWIQTDNDCLWTVGE